MAPYVTLYAERLAGVARQYPFQWYNLYSFWDDPPAPAAGNAAAPAVPAGSLP